MFDIALVHFSCWERFTLISSPSGNLTNHSLDKNGKKSNGCAAAAAAAWAVKPPSVNNVSLPFSAPWEAATSWGGWLTSA